jgi:hypothetical protein
MKLFLVLAFALCISACTASPIEGRAVVENNHASQLIPLAEGKQCTDVDLSAAEDATGKIRSWQSIFSTYKRYEQCDSGGDVSESFSDAVMHLLTTQWGSLPQGQKLFAKDPAFQAFVFSHIDGTANLAELEQVTDSALHRCPSSTKPLCKQIAIAAINACPACPQRLTQAAIEASSR